MLRRSYSCLLVQFQNQRIDLLVLQRLHIRANELLKVFSIHHLLYTKFSQTRTVISYPVLRVVVSPDLLAPVQSSHLRLPLRLLLVHRSLILNLKDFLLQQLSCPLLIHFLTPLLLDKYGQSRWNVGSSAGRLNLVDGLASWSTGTGELILDVFGVNLEGKRDYRHNNHGDCAGMEPALGFGLGYSDDFVDSCLTLHHFVAALALNPHVEYFVSSTGACFFHCVGHPTPPALQRRKCFVHLADVLDEDGAFCASCSWAELQDDIVSLVVRG